MRAISSFVLNYKDSNHKKDKKQVNTIFTVDKYGVISISNDNLKMDSKSGAYKKVFTSKNYMKALDFAKHKRY